MPKLHSGIRAGVVLLAAAALLCAGCRNRPPTLPPPPTLYTTGAGEFVEVNPAGPDNNEIELLYATDRKADIAAPEGAVTYTNERSTELSFGTVRLRIGGDRPWEEVVPASVDPDAKQPTVELVAVTELARFPDNTTAPAEIDGEFDGKARFPEAFTAGNAAATAAVHAKLDEQLAKTTHNDVFVFVHGVALDFDDPLVRLAQLWFYLGPAGVPVAYTWPANLRRRSLLEYTYARESSEFTVNHLRQFLEAVASHPEVHKIHILAHSRGTGITLNVLRDLRLIYKHDVETGREKTKLGNIVLAAPDIDFEVARQLYMPDLVRDMIDRLTVYTYQRDTMLNLSGLLFGGFRRLGSVGSDDPESERIRELNLERSKTDVVEIKTAKKTLGAFGHTYWIDSPEALSDIILVLRDNARVGAENGRPLKESPSGIWELYQGYPGPEEPAGTAKQHPSPRLRR